MVSVQRIKLSILPSNQTAEKVHVSASYLCGSLGRYTTFQRNVNMGHEEFVVWITIILIIILSVHFSNY